MNILYILLLLITLNTFGCASNAGVIYPPFKIPFGGEVRIEKYSSTEALKHFKQTGRWAVKSLGKINSIVGETEDDNASLISNDKISSKPKYLRIDFSVSAETDSYGFMYGNVGIIVKNNIMYTATYDDNGNLVNMDKNSGKPIKYNNVGMNTFDIDTGYNMSGEGMACNLYINNTVIQVKHQDVDSSFGVYLAPHSRIEINNIRWFRGGL